MADSSIHETNDGTKPVRRVCFSELPPKHDKKPRKDPNVPHCRPGCCLCCAWVCMIIFAVLLVLLVAGAIFVGVLKSELPEIRLQKMSFSKLDATAAPSSTSQKTLLSADVDLYIEVSNTNKIVGLSYGTMTVTVRSEKTSLGKTEVVGFSQDPKNVKVLKVRTSVTKSEVDKEEGEFLKTNYKNKEVVLDVLLYGTVGFNGGGLKLNGLPIVVECMKIEQSKVDLGQAPKCGFKLLIPRTLMKALGGGY